jgi:hypothetical protein
VGEENGGIEYLALVKYEQTQKNLGTNGISSKCSVHLQKKTIRRDTNDFGYYFNQVSEYHPIDITQETRVVGLDPGRRTLHVSVFGDSQNDIVQCSTSRWRELSGSKYHANKHATWMKNNPIFQQILTNIHTPCCHSTETYTEHLPYLLSHLDEILGFYGELRWRRLKWKFELKDKRRTIQFVWNLQGEMLTQLLRMVIDHLTRIPEAIHQLQTNTYTRS